MKGEILIFWDSDVIMNSNALRKLIAPIIQGKADISSASGKSIFVKSEEEMAKNIKEFYYEIEKIRAEGQIELVPYVGMGHTAVLKKSLL